MKANFVEMELELINYGASDILTTSGGEITEGGDAGNEETEGGEE